MQLYKYSGPVMEFDRCVFNKYEARTYAASEAKAKSNIAFQFKKKFGMMPNTRVTLPGKLTTD